jgi:hypothetical protein
MSPPPDDATGRAGTKRRIFIGWAGDQSWPVADCLRHVLPRVFEDKVEVWLSEQDISPSEDWFGKILANLRSADAGVFVLTPESRTAPWLLFEAGAIAVPSGESRVYGCLVGLKRDALEALHPLRRYQLSESGKGDVRKLFEALNDKLELHVPPATFKTLFEDAWKKSLKRSIAKAAPAAPPAAAVTAAVRPGAIWSCLVPRLPFDAHNHGQLRRALHAVRDDAYRFVTEELKIDSVTRRDVRACVFVLDVQKMQKGVCELFIPPGFCDWDAPPDPAEADQQEEETKIRFWLEQGLSGQVFVERKPALAVAGVGVGRTGPGAAAGAWAERFRLSDWQKARVHPDIKWIVAFPLCKEEAGVESEGSGEVMGVLAVDGLRFSLTPKQLEALMGTLVVRVQMLGGFLAQSSLDRIVLAVETA